MKFAGCPHDVLGAMWQSAWNTDRGNAARWLCGVKGVTLMQAEAMARHLVGEHCDAIRPRRAGPRRGERVEPRRVGKIVT
jgi:hypothetical protein